MKRTMAKTDPFEQLRIEIMSDAANQSYTELGHKPLFVGSPSARIVIIGQAPGIRAQTSGKPWDDASGLKLMQWLGIDEAVFRDETLIAHMPMDFYYPGKGTSGDLPPRKDFARRWHPRLLALMPGIELTLLIGGYAQKYYLPGVKKTTLTETVRGYQEYLPEYFPLVHPSPLNFRWFNQHLWFETDVLPVLRERVHAVLTS